jgi:hypothetical protein
VVRIAVRRVMLPLFLGFASVVLPGCCGLVSNLGPWGGPAYEIDHDKIGTGEQAIVPRNDELFWDGEPMDLRSDR